MYAVSLNARQHVLSPETASGRASAALNTKDDILDNHFAAKTQRHLELPRVLPAHPASEHQTDSFRNDKLYSSACYIFGSIVE
jgi:hypothetical protein